LTDFFKDIFCPEIHAPENGMLTTTNLVNTKGYPVDTEMTFSCLDGFEIRGSILLKCSKNSKWIGDIPSCQRVESQVKHDKPAKKMDDDEQKNSIEIKSTNISNEVTRDESKSQRMMQLSGCIIHSSSNLFTNEIFVLNKTLAQFMEHGDLFKYSCERNSLAQYKASCNNGSLLLEFKCDENKISKKS